VATFTVACQLVFYRLPTSMLVFYPLAS
jgi:hypothetical protein